MGDFILNLLNSPTFQMLATTFLASVAVDSTISGIKQVKDAIKDKPHEAQLLDSLEMAFFATEQELGWKHDTNAIYESFFGSLLSFSGSFTEASLAKIFRNAVKAEVTEDQISIWITNVLKQISLPEHTTLYRFLDLHNMLPRNNPSSGEENNYILTRDPSVCENKDIIGRDPFINDLLKMLESKNSRIQIAGMGGLGKTETLNKLYARLARNKEIASFDHVGLIRFSGDILSDIQSQVDYPREYLGLQGVEAAKCYLQDICQEKKVLLFLDDIRKEQPLLDERNTSIEFLHSLGASILLAARASFPGFDAHDLEFLSIEECIQIFERQYGRSVANEKDLEILKDIIENRAGNHTMVVNRLGSMAKINHWSIPKLSVKLDEKKFNFAKSIRDDELLQQEINKLYQINDTLSETEKNLLEAFSIFPAAPLSADLCREWLHEDAGVDEDNCARLLNKLAEQTWLEQRCGSDNGDVSFLMHQLVRTAVQEQVEVQYEAHQKLVDKCTVSLYTSTDNYELEKSSLLTPVATSIFKNLFQEKETFSILAFSIAQFYNQTANYKSALEWYMNDLTISEKVLGKDHPDTAKTYYGVASVYDDQGEYDLALEWYLKALAIFERTLDKNHSDIASTYNNIAVVYQNQGKYDLALEWNLKNLAIREKALGKDHPSTAMTYGNIAIVYKNLGKNDLALEWYMKALAIFEKILGKDHLNTANTYCNIANVYSIQGKYDLALEWHLKDLAISEKVLGNDHPSTAMAYGNIANTCQYQGKYDLALEWYQKALAIFGKILGKEHPDTAMTYGNIASVYSKQGKYSLALEWYNKALLVFETKLGSEHPHTKTARKSVEEVENMLQSSN